MRVFFGPLEQFELTWSILDFPILQIFSQESLNFTYFAVIFFYYNFFNIVGLSYWNISLFRVLFFFFLFFFLIYGKNVGGFIWPKSWQIFFEMVYSFLAGIFKEQVGYRGQKYFPFLATTFIFVLFLNYFYQI